MSTPITKPSDRERFAACAAPEAIREHLRMARRQQAEAANWVSWLEVLLARRCREVTDGTWPPPRQEMTPL